MCLICIISFVLTICIICYIIYKILFGDWPQVTERDLKTMIEQDRLRKEYHNDD